MIICAGFVSSGTRLLHEIVDYHMDQPALHRSYPHWDRFWQPEDFEHYFGERRAITWIVIHRDPNIAFKSAVKAGHRGLPDGTLLNDPLSAIKSWYPGWQAIVQRMKDPYHIQYESLVEDPRHVIDELAVYLGVPTPLGSYPYVSDGNSKWR